MIVVLSFPGSNCDQDVLRVCRDVLGLPSQLLWYAHEELPARTDAVILPGGFSFGDYLRPGAIAARTPVMHAVTEFAKKGGPVLGICNGFQMLLEARLLPGALLRNAHLAFRCRPQALLVSGTRAWVSRAFPPGHQVHMPVAHQRGCYVANEPTLQLLHERDQVLLRYPADANPNGSVDGIAAICDPRGRIVGMMPHPERASADYLGGCDGLAWINAWLEGDV